MKRKRLHRIPYARITAVTAAAVASQTLECYDYEDMKVTSNLHSKVCKFYLPKLSREFVKDFNLQSYSKMLLIAQSAFALRSIRLTNAISTLIDNYHPSKWNSG